MRLLIQRVLLQLAVALPLVCAAASVDVVKGWNMLGNSESLALDVTTGLNDPNTVLTVWSWNRTASKWAFYTPSMTPVELADYAQRKGYDVLSHIASKEGYWVNTIKAGTLTVATEEPPQVGTSSLPLSESDLLAGWNLAAFADGKTPAQLNAALSPSLKVAQKSILTLWAWDAAAARWKFYSPVLAAQGGTVLSNYLTSKSYAAFENPIGVSEGFWVNVLSGATVTTTSTSTTSIVPTTSTTSTTTTSTTLPPGTMAIFSETPAPTVLGFNGDTSTIESESTGSTNQVLKIVQTTTAAGLTAGNIAGTNVTLNQAIPLSMTNRSITLRVKAAAAGTYPVMLRLANDTRDASGADPKAIQSAVVSTATTADWQNVTFIFDRYFDSTTYNKLTVFFNYNVAGTNTFYIDDMKLATTTPALASFDEGDLAIYQLSSYGSGITSTSRVNDPQNSANKVAQVSLVATADDWASTVFYNIGNIPSVPNLLTANSQTVKLFVYSSKLAVKVRLKLEDASTYVPGSYSSSRIIEADATTTKVNSWENLTFNFSSSAGYNAAYKYNKATVSFNYGNIAPATFYFENLTPAP